MLPQTFKTYKSYAGYYDPLWVVGERDWCLEAWIHWEVDVIYCGAHPRAQMVTKIWWILVHLSSEMNSKSKNDFISWTTGSEKNWKEDLL